MSDITIKDSGTRSEFTTGAVRDAQAGKGRMDLLPVSAIFEVAKIMEAGAAKYDERNWERGIPLSRFADSGLRHAMKWLRGDRDEPHLAQACWNFLCLLETQDRIAKGRLPAELNDLPCNPIPTYVPDVPVMPTVYSDESAEPMEAACPEKITDIFLDLDDVCNNFTMYALNHVGCPVNSGDYSQFDQQWGWDIVRAATALHPKRAFSTEGFWGCITRNVWADAPLSGEFWNLLDRCTKLVGQDHVFILTCPTRDPDSLAGKLEWIQKVLPSKMHRQFLIGPPKHLCAKPNSLLIDDRETNVDAFRAAGGHAIIMPRPWNCMRDRDPWGHVSHCLDEFFGIK